MTGTTHYFGTAQQAFKKSHLKKLISNGKVKKAKKYILTHFCKIANPIGIARWNPKTKDCDIIEERKAKERYITADLVNGDFNARKWFFNDHEEEFRFGHSITDGRTYEDEYGQSYINLFQGYLFDKNELLKFEEYDDEVKEGVTLILNHIKNVLCSGNEDAYNYLLNWVSCVCCGRRMTTAVYFNSIQGTGKSMFTEFLKRQVLGLDICYCTSDPSLVMPDKFNGQLSGRVLLSLEELPAMNINQWHGLTNSIKNLVTGDTFEIKTKNKTNREVDNILSFIITSNNKALKITDDERRFFMPDVSSDRVGDYKYFSSLKTAMTKEGVGEAFYAFCVERFNNLKNFQEQRIPKTTTKNEAIIDNLSPVFEFLKNKYLKTRHGDIDIPTPEFYTRFCNFVNSTKTFTRIQFFKQLKRLKCVTIKKMAVDNKQHVLISYRDLYDEFNKKGWIHELDDITHPDEINEEDEETELDELEELKQENEQLKKRIADLEYLLKNGVDKKKTKKKKSKKIKNVKTEEELTDAVVSLLG